MNKRYIEYYDPSLGVVPYHKPIEYTPPDVNSHYERVTVKEPFYFYVN